jgi:signal transduction histidine kinase
MKQIATKIKVLALDKSLLLVEDDSVLLFSLKKLLEHFFVRIYTATNLHEALAIYGAKYIDEQFLVISDINLGRESGVDLSYALRSLNPKQRVIAISASQDSTVFIKSIECGIDRFLLKPIKNEKLFETLMVVLKMIEYDRELQESQRLLEESREYAIKLLAEQDEFLKNAIHEIHTPLAVIITNIDLLRMKGIEDESLQAIEAGSRIIENSYEDMTYLMKRDRDISQRDSIDLLAFVEERCRYFESIATAHGLKLLLFSTEPNLPLLKFVPIKLSRLVDNTLSNAIKYAYKPSTIEITLGQKEGALYFEVQNFGVVIEDTQQIFERFYRESDTKGGYGLGLHIVSLICKEEHVSIKVSSNTKNGTLFRYTFHKEEERV